MTRRIMTAVDAGGSTRLVHNRRCADLRIVPTFWRIALPDKDFGRMRSHNPRVPLGASGPMISTRRAELVEADRHARYDKRTRTPCLYGLSASRKADLHEPGAGDSPADLCRGPVVARR
jgi:hypothetical protein